MRERVDQDDRQDEKEGYKQWTADARIPAVKLGRATKMLVSLALVSLSAVCGQDTDGNPLEPEQLCLFHDDCSPVEFCRVSTCTTVEGVDIPCGKCSPCGDCLCHSKASDGKCPSKCAFESAWVTLFQGMFAVFAANEADPEDLQLGNCVQFWDVQGRFFSSYYVWLPSASAVGDEHRNNCTERKVDGVFDLDTFAVPSPMRLSYTTTTGTACNSRLAYVSNDCKGGLQLDWAAEDTSEEQEACVEPTFPSSSFRLIRTERGLADNQAPWEVHWAGSVLMYSTTCTAAFSFTSVLPSQGLFRWYADVYNCTVGPDPAAAVPIDVRSSASFSPSIEALRSLNDPQAAMAIQHAQPISAPREGAHDASGCALGVGMCDAVDDDHQRRAGLEPGVVPPTGATARSNCAGNANGNQTGCAEHATCQHAFYNALWNSSDRAFEPFFQRSCLFNETRMRMRECAAYNHSYVCRCDTGFDGDGLVCRDVDECAAPGACHADALCTNTPGSHLCACVLGFDGDGIECEEINECEEETHTCNLQATCANTRGSFTCTCDQGFVGDGIDCGSTSEISVERVYPNGVHLVFTLTWAMAAPPHAEDVIALFKTGVVRRQLLWLYSTAPECEKPQAVCVGSNPCVNVCHRSGAAAVGRSRSLNIELFSAGVGDYQALLYSHAARAVVAQAQYTIAFPPSPAMLTTPHPDDNPADGTPAVAPTPAPPVAPPGTVFLESITPDTGFTAHGGLDDCELDGAACEFVFSEVSSVYIPGQSVQAPPFLRCGDGRLSPDNAEQCDDGNNENGDGCNSTCFEQPGWNCSTVVIPAIELDELTGLYHTVGPGGDSQCMRGPHCGDRRRNVEGEECDDGNVENGDGCSSQCTVEGGWKCERTPETLGESCSGVVVLNFDKRNCPPCHEFGECVLYMGSERCRCTEGFAADAADEELPNPLVTAAEIAAAPHECEDIDECGWAEVFQRQLCEHNSLVCVNTQGSFSCSCDGGMEYIPADLDDRNSKAQCIDINECTRVDASSRTGHLHDCHEDARCSNTVGSFMCDCPEFFSGEGVGENGCEDVDECRNLTTRCSADATCLNHRFGFTCQCGEGLAGSGFVCIDADWYDTNKDWWERMGQNGAPVRQSGQLRATPFNYFLPHLVGQLRWSVSGADRFDFASMYQVPSQRIPPTLSCGGVNCERQTALGEAGGRIEVELDLHTTERSCAWTFSKFAGEYMLLRFEAWDLEPGLHHLEVCRHRERGRIFNFYRQGAYDCDVYNATQTPPYEVLVPTPGWVELYTAALPLADPAARQWLPHDHASPQRSLFVFEYSSFLDRDSVPASVDVSAPLRVRYAPGIWPAVKGPEGLVFGVTNDARPGVQPPCSFSDGYDLPHSTYRMMPRTQVPVLEGMWKGECRTVGDDQRQCKVDMTVQHGVLSMWVSGCDGVVGAGLTTGILTASGRTEQQWLSVERDVSWMQRYELHFTSGDERKTRFGSQTVGRATVIWRDGGQNVAQFDGSELTMGVLRPGERSAAGTEFPGDFPDTMEFGTHDCGVMQLRKAAASDVTLSLPGEGQSTAFLQAASALNRYRECNASLHEFRANLSSASPDCRSLGGLIDTRRWPSLPELPSWEGVCLSSCYSLLRTELDRVARSCTAAWQEFAESPWVDVWSSWEPDSPVGRMTNFFAARVMTVLDLQLKLDLACQHNLDRTSCLATAAAAPQVFGSCALYQPQAIGWSTVLDFVAPAFLLPDNTGAGSACPLDCWNAMLESVVSDHCCYAFVHAARARWLDAFLPAGTFPNPYFLDLAPYTCGYDQGCLSNAIPYRVERSGKAEGCENGAEGVVAEECAHEACGVDLWHRQCCAVLSCGDGGRVPYHGACWCECPFPMVGAECEGRGMHVTVEMTIREMTLHRFNERAFLASLASAAGLREDQAEMSALALSQGRRRLAAEDDAAEALQGSESVQRPRGRRAGEEVVAGARLMAESAEEASRVAKWLNGEGGQVWKERMASWVLVSVPLGSSAVVDMVMSAAAVPVAADGSTICLDCNVRPQLENAEEGEGSSLSRSAAMGLGIGLALSCCCCCCCYCKLAGHNACGGVPRKLWREVSHGVKEARGAAKQMMSPSKKDKEDKHRRRAAAQAKERGVFEWRRRGSEEQRSTARPYFAGPQSNQVVTFQRGTTPRIGSSAADRELSVYRKPSSAGQFTPPDPVPHPRELSQDSPGEDVEVSAAPARTVTAGIDWREAKAASKGRADEQAASSMLETGREAPPRIDWVKRVIENHERLHRKQQVLLSALTSMQSSAASMPLLSPPLSPLTPQGPTSLWSPNNHLGANLTQQGSLRRSSAGGARSVHAMSSIGELAPTPRRGSVGLLDDGDVEGSVASFVGSASLLGSLQPERSAVGSLRSGVGGGRLGYADSVSSRSGSEAVRDGWMGFQEPMGMGVVPEDSVSLPAGVTRRVLRDENMGSTAASPLAAIPQARPRLPAPSAGQGGEEIIFDEIAVTPVSGSYQSSRAASVASVYPSIPPPSLPLPRGDAAGWGDFMGGNAPDPQRDKSLAFV